jgi:hypothetical protein
MLFRNTADTFSPARDAGKRYGGSFGAAAYLRLQAPVVRALLGIEVLDRVAIAVARPGPQGPSC